MALHVTSGDGASHTITGVARLEAGTGVGMHCDNVRAIRVNRPAAYAAYFDSAYSKLIGNLRYISMLNGMVAEESGHVWLWTDMCMNWALPGETPDQQTAGGASGGLTIYDGCAACSDCAAQLSIKKRFERLRLLLNDLKDVNLYTTQDKAQRMNYLLQQRLSTPDNCGAAKEYDYGADNWLDSYRLLLNYMTAVHMWNYVVSQNNSSTVIRSAAEDNTGFYVQTKRALPSCDGKSTLQCRITIKARSVQDNISVLVARKKTEFKPFDNSSVSDSSLLVSEFALEKVFTTNFPAGVVSGTYIVEVKVIPFMYVQITAPDGTTVDMNNLDWSVDSGLDKDIEIDGNTYEGKQYVLGECKVDTEVLQAPTLEQYNSSKAYPAKSVAGSNYWDVNITWTLTGALAGNAGTRVWEENYIYTTVKAREPLNGLLFATDLIDIVELTEGGEE